MDADPEEADPKPATEAPAGKQPRWKAVAVLSYAMELPGVLWRVLRSPETGLGDARAEGPKALVHGSVLGVVAVAVIAWEGPSPEAGLVMAWLGGLVFLAAGILASFVLRAVVGKAKAIDWHDDVYLMGCALCYPMAAALISMLVGLVPVVGGVTPVIRLAGFLLAAFAYAEGVVEVGGVRDSRRIWITVFTLAVAVAASSSIGFGPV